MARFSGDARLVQAIIDGVDEMQRGYKARGWFDGHNLINWLNVNRSPELNDIYDLYADCKDPEMTADQQIGRYLYRLKQVKIAERISTRRINRRSGFHRNGVCQVSVWEISSKTIHALSVAKIEAIDDNLDSLLTLATEYSAVDEVK